MRSRSPNCWATECFRRPDFPAESHCEEGRHMLAALSVCIIQRKIKRLRTGLSSIVKLTLQLPKIFLPPVFEARMHVLSKAKPEKYGGNPTTPRAQAYFWLGTATVWSQFFSIFATFIPRMMAWICENSQRTGSSQKNMTAPICEGTNDFRPQAPAANCDKVDPARVRRSNCMPLLGRARRRTNEPRRRTIEIFC